MFRPLKYVTEKCGPVMENIKPKRILLAHIIIILKYKPYAILHICTYGCGQFLIIRLCLEGGKAAV